MQWRLQHLDPAELRSKVRALWCCGLQRDLPDARQLRQIVRELWWNVRLRRELHCADAWEIRPIVRTLWFILELQRQLHVFAAFELRSTVRYRELRNDRV